METQKFKPKKKTFKQGPNFRVFEGENRDFLTAVNEKLANLPDISTEIRKILIENYGSFQRPLSFMSPVYFAAAVAFLYKYPKGPTKTNFTNENLNNYVTRNITETPSSVSKASLEIRRKTEFLRYIRLVMKIDEEIKGFKGL
jgi:hypothetical protein